MATGDKPSGHTLRPRARVLQALGSELISSEVVALSELVKNSYDADATRVLIRINPHGDGVIEVIDNGIGMSLATIRSAWLEPATPSKLDNSVSRLGRRVLGAKGIGRFAAAKLAKHLDVITRPADAQQEAWAKFDWSQFDDPHTYLDEITIPCGAREPQEIVAGGTTASLWPSDETRPAVKAMEHGTVLRMSSLKAKWDTARVEDLHRALSRLILPRRDDTFHVKLTVAGGMDGESSNDIEPPELIRYPHYRILGVVRADGRYRIQYSIEADAQRVTKKGRLVRQLSVPFDLISVSGKAPKDTKPIASGPLRLNFRIWDRDDLGNIVQRTHSTIRNVRADLDAIAGISLYRDGFRVLPYGEPHNDWLRLDIRRVQKPTMRLSNNQLYGFVEISADSNTFLSDQSNREGLVEGQALQDLRDIILRVLTELENLRYKSRPRENKSTSRETLFSRLSLNTVRDSLGARAEEPEVRQALELADHSIAAGIREVKEVLGRYHRLATLGQLIDVVLHDGRQPVASITNQSDLGIEAARRPSVNALTEITPRFVVIRAQAGNLATLFNRIAPFGGRKKGRPKQLYMEDIIRDAFSVYEQDIKALNVSVSLPASTTLVRVDSTELQEIVLNLLQNSLYWLKQVPETKRAISVTIDRTPDGALHMVFSDSGPGVDPQHRDSIFEPYFSTKPDGVGLGLSIAGEIASDYYDGSLDLLDSGPLSGATFRLSLRKRV